MRKQQMQFFELIFCDGDCLPTINTFRRRVLILFFKSLNKFSIGGWLAD